MNYIKAGPRGVDPETRDIARSKAESIIPLSERPRSSYGSLEMSLQLSEGLCTRHRKCVLKSGHAQPCWPGD